MIAARAAAGYHVLAATPSWVRVYQTAMRPARVLFESPLVRICEVACDAPRGGDAGVEVKEISCIAFPLRGCFAVERQAQTIVADANTAMFFDTATPHRVSHPADSGDLSLTLTLDDAATADAFGGSLPATHAPVDPALQLRIRLLRRSIAAGAGTLAIEEAALAIAAELAGLVRTRLTHARFAGVERAKAFLGQHFRNRVLLADAARAAGTSPFWLARAFPWATGMTMHRYLVALRHADVLDALSSGETNLARAAVDAGFAHHSHLTKTLSRAFGTTPSALRLQIAAPRGADRR